MAASVSVVEAKAHFSKWLRAAEDGTSVVITRHGRPVAALVPSEDLENLQRLRAARGPTGLAGLAGGWEGSDELVKSLARHRRSKAKRAARLD